MASSCLVLGRVDVAFNCSQSSNTIITNTSSDHQTYLPFGAGTNKMWVVLFVVFPPNVNTVVCTEHNLTFIWKYYFFSVVVYWSTSSLFKPLDSLFSIRFPKHHFLFRWPSFLTFRMQHHLHGFLAESICFAQSFSSAVMSCKVTRLLLLTKHFKAFLFLFVKLLFLPLRVKVSTCASPSVLA